MESFSIDLDQALNDLERLEEIEVKEKLCNKNINLDEILSELEKNEIENETNLKEKEELNNFENELNEIVQQLVANVCSNEQFNQKETSDEQCNKNEPNEINIKEKIEVKDLETNIDESELKKTTRMSVETMETCEENISSTNEDSEFFFDTIDKSIQETQEITIDSNTIEFENNFKSVLDEKDKQFDEENSNRNESSERLIEKDNSDLNESDKNLNKQEENQEKEQTEEEKNFNIDESKDLINENNSTVSKEQIKEEDQSEENLNKSIDSNNEQHSTISEEQNNNLNNLDDSNSYDQENKSIRIEESIETNLVTNPSSSIQIVDFETEWSQLTESEKMLGLVAPVWMMDTETDICMKCSAKFTFRRRRHHCRACGLIFCSVCCHSKISLSYILSKSNVKNNANESNMSEENVSKSKETSRVCHICYETINKVNSLRFNMQKAISATPIVGVLKKKNQSGINEISSNTEQNQSQQHPFVDGQLSRLVRSKSVRFSDGLMPGYDSPTSNNNNENDISQQIDKENDKLSKKKIPYLLNKKYKISSKNTFRQSKYIEEELIFKIKLHLMINNYLPPILLKDEIIDATNEAFNEEKLIQQELLDKNGSQVIVFMLLRNLKVSVRIVDLKCCSNGKCWLFVTNGLAINGQDELIFLLKCKVDPETNEVNESSIQRQILYNIMDIYEKTSKGFKLNIMNHYLYDFETAKMSAEKIFLEGSTSNRTYLNDFKTDCADDLLVENAENIGFFYFRPTIHHHKCCLKTIQEFTPEGPFLVGYLIQKSELSWAKLFPLRLFLRLGEEFNSYPCSIVNDRNRKKVFGEIGHTIMSLLCDVRNFQYTIAQIDGLSIQLIGSNTKILIPESQYDLIIKSLLTSNEYVFSLALLQIDEACSSYLVCVENENLGTYASKTIDVYNSETNDKNKVIGAAFVVFNGALKPNATHNAKVSVIEDGIMIQIEIETMEKLKQALQSMKPFRIECNKPPISILSQQNESIISIEWVKEDKHINNGVLSVIDGLSMHGVKSLRLTSAFDYVNDTKAIRWTEIFLIKIEDESNSVSDNNFNLNRFAEMCAQACCTALVPLLDDLIIIQQNYLHRKKLQTEKKVEKGENSDVNEESIFKSDYEEKKFAKAIDPFRLALRIQVSKDQVGYLIGMNGKQISQEKFLVNLDNELIQILHHANTFSLNILLEFIFYVQERFNCSNKLLT